MDLDLQSEHHVIIKDRTKIVLTDISTFSFYFMTNWLYIKANFIDLSDLVNNLSGLRKKCLKKLTSYPLARTSVVQMSRSTKN